MELYMILTLVGALLASGIALFYWWLHKNDDYWLKRGVPYEPRSNLITATRGFLSSQLHLLMLEAQKKHGRVYGIFEFGKPALTVSEPELLRDILVKDFHVFHYRRDFPLSDPIFSKAVSLMKGEDWKRVRNIITPAFTSRRMRQMSHIIRECTENVIEILGKYHENGEPADVKRIFGAYTLDVIASTAFATKINTLADPDNLFVKNAKKTLFQPVWWRLILFFTLPSWLMSKFDFGFKEPLTFFKNVILQVIEERRKTGKKYNDMLQLFLDAQEETEKENIKEREENEDETDQYGSITSSELTARKKYKKMSHDELIAQCVIFFFVGYETTASVMTYMAYSLALNPECQEKLIEEVDEIFENNEEINYDVVRDMKYLDCVVSETLRMYPSLTRSERTASEDYKLGNTGIVIEKGTIVGFNIHAMHHDPEFFPNPDVFDPERFKPENRTYPQYAYLPFGEGPRNCLGMRFALLEIKVALTMILRLYKFKKAETTKVPLIFRAGQGLLSVTDLPLLIEKRNRD